jgi:hypothetical protein
MELLFPDELNLLENPVFYQLKQRLSDKIQLLLGECSRELAPVIEAHADIIPEHIRAIPPKISRGENYLGFPWMILDQPRYFKNDDVFAIRTLCWWANSFSITLQLAGPSLQRSLPGLTAAATLLAGKGYYAGINKDPWLHHFGSDNYTRLSDSTNPAAIIKTAAENGFLKIMQRITLDQYAELPSITPAFAQTVFQAIRR